MKFEFESIGHIRSSLRYTQEAPRQGTLTDKRGIIELLPGKNFETALADLEDVERIWIIFVFDRVNSWKPKVRPPFGGKDQRIGVFATRSPHRPNPIGITCAKLDGIRGRFLDVSEIDLLSGTPVLDIKPYIPMADSFPEAKIGWRDKITEHLLTVNFSEGSRLKCAYILENGGPDVAEFCRVQLGTRDIDPKRLRLSGPDEAGIFTLAFRTWRIFFIRTTDDISVQDIRSGYLPEELFATGSDPYLDKELHRRFNAQFKQ
jgi:tRNA-Thr(GGU) m(6)t(6)A37 methyltransferase TsaA